MVVAVIEGVLRLWPSAAGCGLLPTVAEAVINILECLRDFSVGAFRSRVAGAGGWPTQALFACVGISCCRHNFICAARQQAAQPFYPHSFAQNANEWATRLRTNRAKPGHPLSNVVNPRGRIRTGTTEAFRPLPRRSSET